MVKQEETKILLVWSVNKIKKNYRKSFILVTRAGNVGGLGKCVRVDFIGKFIGRVGNKLKLDDARASVLFKFNYS